jgi:hypothetical protein
MVAEAAAQGEAAWNEASEPVEVASAQSSPAFSAAFAAPQNAAQPAIGTVSVPASAAVTGPRYVSNPVVQQLPGPQRVGFAAGPAAPAAPRIAAASQRRMAPPATALPGAAPAGQGPATHLVQLGAYDSKVEAARGWSALQAKFPQLKDRKPVITEAVVNGRTFWRVAAEGFTAQSARAMCGTIKSQGRGCFAYAAATPPVGAVQRDVQVAARTR